MAMSDLNEDRTVAFDEHSKERAAMIGVADVPKARLVCTDRSQVESTLPGEGVIHLVPGAEQTVGRGETCTYPIGSRKLSRQHARIFPGVGAWGIEDLNSTNGVRVNDEKVHTAWLKHGDVIRIGPIPFHFEVDRPDIAAAAAAVVHHPAGGGDGEHTMMFSGTGGAKAAEVMLKAVREAEKTDEPPPTIVPTTPTKTAQKAAKPAATNNGRIIGLILAATAVVVLIAGGIIYYPAFRKAKEVAALVERGNKTTDRVIIRSRDFSGSAAGEGAYLDDLKTLQPVISESNDALSEDPDSRELGNLHARARFLVFEREFASLFNRPDPDGKVLKSANRQAIALRADLDKIAHQVSPQTGGADQDILKTTADLADLAAILVSYRTFVRKFPQIAKASGDQPTPTPTLEQINTVDARKKDFTQYSKTYHQVLTRDYRLFNSLVTDVENRDFSLVTRWREFLGTGR